MSLVLSCYIFFTINVVSLERKKLTPTNFRGVLFTGRKLTAVNSGCVSDFTGNNLKPGLGLAKCSLPRN